jgi:putative restriction endonuclease
MNYPISLYSWMILSDGIVAKHPDKSVFDDNGTGIPQKMIVPFFNVGNMKLGERIDVDLEINGTVYKAYFTRKLPGQIQLIWYSNLKAFVRNRFPDYEKRLESSPRGFLKDIQIQFQPIGPRRYKVFFLDKSVATHDWVNIDNEDNIVDTAFQSNVENAVPSNIRSQRLNYWWVNQNQTYSYEISDGYMWSPKKKTDGSSNIFYDNMAKVHIGDIVFSFFETKISYLGVIKSHGYSQIKPQFGNSGDAWKSEGWMVNVDYRKMQTPIRPKDHIEMLRPLLPNKYSPLQENGNGNQGVYLTRVPEDLARQLLELLRPDSELVIMEGIEHQGEVKTDQEAEEDVVERSINKGPLTDTEKETLIRARKGQGQFREDVIKTHKRCPFTGVSNADFLRAGHLKPWRKCENNQERLDPYNGFPLTPVVDHLVDRGYLSFEPDGRVIFSPLLDPKDIKAMGLNTHNDYRITVVNDRQKAYLAYHRAEIFKQR